METVRIFTGAPTPEGADAILIQENARSGGGLIEPLQSVVAGQFIRAAGLDFFEGATLLHAGARLGPGAIALAAAMNHAELPLVRRPRVAILATGDELVAPGATPSGHIRSSPRTPSQLRLSSNGLAASLVDLGIARDDLAALERGIRAAIDGDCDVLATSGGASVGDHDLIKPALSRAGMELNFWRINVRPGAPLVHGRIGRMAILGLPGNPVSAIVTGLLFLSPLVRALSGDPHAASDRSEAAVLGAPVRANDARQDYLRARLEPGGEGLPSQPLSRRRIFRC